MPPANTTAITATTISSTAYNTLGTDIGTELTNSLDRLGRSAMQAALPMGGNKITGMADPTVATDATTKNYTDALVSSFFSTGDGKITLKAVADTGWILCDDGTFGSASSGASNRANADTLALFTLFFNNISDTAAPILTSGGGATTRAAQTSASAAWAANCRMSLTKQLGRALAIAGAGSGLTTRPLGSNAGAETSILLRTDLPNATLSSTIAAVSGTGTFSKASDSGVSAQIGGPMDAVNGITQTGSPRPFSVAVPGQTVNTTSLNGNVAQTAVSILPPETYWNVMVKL